VRASLLLDSIKPDLRQEWLHKAAEHTHRVWIIHSHQPSMAASADSDLSTLAKLKAQCIALIPEGCILFHTAGFWQNAEWDCQTSEHAAQLWLLGDSAPERINEPYIDLSLEALGDWSSRRHDFQRCRDPALSLYLQF
jgi:hypothetical protein